jgi:hypothetical protein
MNIRDWNVPYVIVTLISLGFLALILWAQNRIPSAVIYMSFGYITSQPMFWLMTFFSITVCTLPLYAASRVQYILLQPTYRAV